MLRSLLLIFLLVLSSHAFLFGFGQQSCGCRPPPPPPSQCAPPPPPPPCGYSSGYASAGGCGGPPPYPMAPGQPRTGYDIVRDGMKAATVANTNEAKLWECLSRLKQLRDMQGLAPLIPEQILQATSQQIAGMKYTWLVLLYCKPKLSEGKELYKVTFVDGGKGFESNVPTVPPGKHK
ncbi:hypothetical protein PRIPAC_71951 [Pristionchus pacificus]|uniref:Uncharacterized protein n=1 Tax=Pristionchus pacificus TaxID=54126 RepID=A0A2A6CT02_PRIPA|nr:hypothetical protein PRIPAC_71951 [Pristionchus pacificus]|eukprot:PDM81269.1 hypothetical protein PRIPAC_36272 [Pristionchus pacificus]